jgi:hypothetical protein
MPRSTTSTRARRHRTMSTPETTGVHGTMTTATANETEADAVRELPFTVEITPADPDFKPDRSPAGRKRTPSPFEAILPDLKGKGWQNQPHDGNVKPDENGKYNTGSSVKESNAKAILRELSKAQKFLNSPEGGELNLGLDVNVTEELVQFNIRDKQNRKPRSAPGGGDVTDGESVDSGDDETSGDE